jgi:hypothetical protein
MKRKENNIKKLHKSLRRKVREKLRHIEEIIKENGATQEIGISERSR